MIPEDRHYTQEHEWIKVDGEVATVGITDHAQNALGDLTFVELPEVGEEVTQGDEACVVESSKAASDVYSPASGEVTDVNKDLEENPGLVNSEPFEDGWLYKIRLKDASELESLMDASSYAELIGE